MKYALASLSAAALMAPLFALAQTPQPPILPTNIPAPITSSTLLQPLGDASNTVQGLLDQLKDLQAKLDALRAGFSVTVPVPTMLSTSTLLGTSTPPVLDQVISTAFGGGPVDVTPPCELLTMLKQGSVGNDVKCLQETLHAAGVYNGPITGFFGVLTRTAVQEFQAMQGIVAGGNPETTGFGVVGPKTLQAIISVSGSATAGSGTMVTQTGTGGGGSTTGTLASDASSGSLTVNFWYYLGDAPSDGYTINFGDGSSATPEVGCASDPHSMANACPRGLVTSHTYATAGTYTVTVSNASGAVATLNVVVGSSASSTGSTLTAEPTSGTAPLTVNFQVTPGGTYSISFGDGQSGTMSPAPTCATCQTLSTAGHVYSAAGTYTASVYRHLGGPMGPDQFVGSVTITVR